MRAEGGVILAAKICPNLFSDLFHLVIDEKDYEHARGLYLRMLRLFSCMQGPTGKIVQIAKREVERVRYTEGPSRPPRAPLDEEEKKELKRILRDLDLI